MNGLKATLECIHQVNIRMDDDVWYIEKGEKVECMICNDGIKLKFNENCWYTLKPSLVNVYFKII